MRKKILWGILGVFLVAIGYAGWRFGPALYDFWKGGYFDPVEMRKYQGTSKDNLKNLYTAMMLYHESEGAFPPSEVWMDRIKPYIRTGDLPEEEAVKKFRNPLIRPASPSTYGYAMNDAFSSQYQKDVIGAGSLALIFDSADTGWNAHGSPDRLAPKPARAGGNWMVTGEGSVRTMN